MYTFVLKEYHCTNSSSTFYMLYNQIVQKIENRINISKIFLFYLFKRVENKLLFIELWNFIAKNVIEESLGREKILPTKYTYTCFVQQNNRFTLKFKTLWL